MKLQILGASACLLAASCAPTNMPMEQAEAQCVQYALGGGGGVTVGMSVGTGNWDNSWGGWGYGRGNSGVGVGMTASTQLPPSQGMAQVYANCVQRRTGQPPVTPFNQRPELRG